MEQRKHKLQGTHASYFKLAALVVHPAGTTAATPSCMLVHTKGVPHTCMMLARSISLSLSARMQRSLTDSPCSRVRLPAPPANAMPGGRKGRR